MISSRVLILLSLLGLPICASAETVFIRQLGPNEDKSEIRQAAYFFSKDIDLNTLREELKNRKWPEVVSEVNLDTVSHANRNPASIVNNPSILDGQAYICVNYLGKTLFSRETTAEQTRLFETNERITYIDPTTALDQFCGVVKKTPQEAATLKIELLYSFSEQDPFMRPYLRVLSFQRREKFVDSEKLSELYKTYAIGRSVDAITYVQPKVPLRSKSYIVAEEFRSDNRSINVLQYLVTERDEDYLLELCYDYTAKILDTEYGKIIYASREKNLDSNGRARIYHQKWIWIAAKTHVITIAETSAHKNEQHELLSIYGKRFPSLIQKEFSLNFDGWAKRRVTQSIQRIQHSLWDETKQGNPFAIDDFYSEWNYISGVLGATNAPQMPVYPAAIVTRIDSTAQMKDWWSINQNLLQWDPATARLVKRKHE